MCVAKVTIYCKYQITILERNVLLKHKSIIVLNCVVMRKIRLILIHYRRRKSQAAILLRCGKNLSPYT